MASKHGIGNGMARRDLERLRYWQGQKLRSKDFNDLAQIEDQLRWWHNRSLHEIPGVLEGLTVHLDGTDAIISPGLAYDGFGRELIHAHESRFPLPNPLPDQDLILLAYLPSYERRVPSASGACLPSPLRSPARHLSFTWLRVDDIHRTQTGVPLGRLVRGLEGPVFDPGRGFTRPLARPRIASGSTRPGSTDWGPWQLDDTRRRRLGLQVRVDTSAAGFTRIPCYFAWIQGVNWLAPEKKDAETKNADPFDNLTVEHIDEASENGFTFRLATRFIAMLLDRSGLDPDRFLWEIKPYVCWIGIENPLGQAGMPQMQKERKPPGPVPS